MSERRVSATGIGYGVAAGLCWGVIFLAPALVPDLGGAQFAVLRFLCYGGVSLVLLLPRWHRLRAQLTRSDGRRLFWLSLIGNLGYYALVGAGVQQAGIAATTLIVGLIPLLVALAGHADTGAVGVDRLWPSMACALLGVGLISYEALTVTALGAQPALGLLCACGALLAWSWFAVANTRHLTVTAIGSHDWALLLGGVTGLQALLAAPFLLGPELLVRAPQDWVQPLVVAAGVALLASVVGGFCWNQASRRLPLTLSGQAIVIETLSSLLYGFLWQWRLPTLLEALAIGLLIVGVVWCLRCHQQPVPTSAPAGSAC
ncbi:DMT family transporter [Pseudomonas oryzihabitans]|uniref:DMT family transporter n=1 Tax=Pseudomonas oryzihabitans TaxID=47885 RepID=UPI00214EF4F7|nr:DMT family transporter [Pseudomonas psychrotolerans]UUW69901.1 DMT family transporter [Pseudomonas psychrotolerans]